MNKIDMTGWKMSEHGVPDSKLTVLYEVEPHITSGGNRQVQYLCRCECGKEIKVLGARLRNGNTKSCGCIHSNQLINRNIQQGRQIKINDCFGKLTVIADLGMRKQKSRNKNWRWSLCQCDCGSEPIEVPNNLLINGHKTSCGCIGSVGELKIEQLLKENHLQYIKEYKFNDLYNSKTHYQYRFDFAVFQNDEIIFLIEFDGRQHFTGPESTWKNTRSLEQIKWADQEKNNYCKEHNLILKRIPYFNLSQITIDNILSNKWDII